MAEDREGQAPDEARTRTIDEALQNVQQAAQAARQATQQAEQAVQAAQQAARGVGAETSSATVETEVRPGGIGLAWGSNNKRTYDAYQDLDLIAARRSQQEYDKLQVIAQQALQNAVETANMCGKQGVRHGDFSIDRQWAGTDATQAAGDASVLRILARLLAGRPDDVVGEDE